MAGPNTVTVDSESKKERKKHGIIESINPKKRGTFYYKEVVRERSKMLRY